MINLFYALFSQVWSGLVLAAFVAGLGWAVVRLTRQRWRPVRFAGYGLWVLAGLMTIGSGVAIVGAMRARADNPPMGRLVDVGGYRMHILAEGRANGRPTVVWIPGGHSTGLGFWGHHKQMRGEARSILFDRPGTGWSDAGPFPRRTAREAEELATLLQKAGERGPFILVGHSYGGLLAANFARRYPSRTAAVVLLDATQPDSMIYNRAARGNALGIMVKLHGVQGFLKLFGIQFDPYAGFARQYSDIARIQKLQDAYLSEVRAPLKAFTAFPAADFTSASIYGEFNPDNIARTAPDLMVYDGELNPLPVRVVIPKNDPAMEAYARASGADPAGRRLAEIIRARYVRVSDHSTLLHPPAGTGHNFPYETPQYVTQVVRDVLAETASKPRQSAR